MLDQDKIFQVSKYETGDRWTALTSEPGDYKRHETDKETALSWIKSRVSTGQLIEASNNREPDILGAYTVKSVSYSANDVSFARCLRLNRLRNWRDVKAVEIVSTNDLICFSCFKADIYTRRFKRIWHDETGSETVQIRLISERSEPAPLYCDLCFGNIGFDLDQEYYLDAIKAQLSETDQEIEIVNPTEATWHNNLIALSIGFDTYGIISREHLDRADLSEILECFGQYCIDHKYDGYLLRGSDLDERLDIDNDEYIGCVMLDYSEPVALDTNDLYPHHLRNISIKAVSEPEIKPGFEMLFSLSDAIDQDSMIETETALSLLSLDLSDDEIRHALIKILIWYETPESERRHPILIAGEILAQHVAVSK